MPGQLLTYILDGHNILYATRSAFLEHLVEGHPGTAAREALVQRLLGAFTTPGHEVVLFFDGKEAQCEYRSEYVRVIYSGGDGDQRADRAILREVAERAANGDGATIIVVTRDIKLARRARKRGAGIMAPEAFLEACGLLAGDRAMADNLLVDDFRGDDGVSALGTRWEGFTDRVMGGRSEMQVGYRDGDAGRVLAMTGQVRLENRGGFIQARLPLNPDGGSFDASAWLGLRITVRGAPGPYFIHLRTRQTWQPWQYFRAPIEVGPEWREQFIPFESFEGRATWRRLDTAALKSIGVVAYGEAFEAEIEIARLEMASP